MTDELDGGWSEEDEDQDDSDGDQYVYLAYLEGEQGERQYERVFDSVWPAVMFAEGCYALYGIPSESRWRQTVDTLRFGSELDDTPFEAVVMRKLVQSSVSGRRSD